MMNTANSAMHARHGNPAVEKTSSAPLRPLQFIFQLLTSTLAAFALATIILVTVKACLEQVKPGTARAVPTQEHAGLPAFADKLVHTCWQRPQITLLVTPAARCIALASMAVQHLAGTAGAGALMKQLGIGVASAAVNCLQTVVRLGAPVWLVHGRRVRMFLLS